MPEFENRPTDATVVPEAVPTNCKNDVEDNILRTNEGRQRHSKYIS